MAARLGTVSARPRSRSSNRHTFFRNHFAVRHKKKNISVSLKNIDMSLAQSPSFTNASRPLKSTRLPSDAYVLSLAALPSRYAASASAPSNKIHIFDSQSFRAAQSLSGHEGGTTSLRAVDAIIGTNQRSLISSGRDSTVKVWDDRSGSVAIQSTFSFFVVSPSTRRFDHSKNKYVRFVSSAACRETARSAMCRCFTRRYDGGGGNEHAGR